MKRRLSSLAIALLLTVNSIVPGSVSVSAAEPEVELESIVLDETDDVVTDENSETEIEVIDTDDEASYEESAEESDEAIEILDQDPTEDISDDADAEISIEDIEEPEVIDANPEDVYGLTGYAPITDEEFPGYSEAVKDQEVFLDDFDYDQENYEPLRLGDTANETRYTVLVLDTSGTAGFLDSSGNIFYTADTAITYVKAAAKTFLDSMKHAPGKNYVAIVQYKEQATTISDFTQDFDSLKKKVDSLSAGSNVRDISTGIDQANSLLQKVAKQDVIRNTIIFTTGMSNAGKYSYTGKYNEFTVGSIWRRMDTQIRLYAYSNYAYARATELKKISNVYTLGLFQTMKNMPSQGQDIAAFFKIAARDLATKIDYFYPVSDPNNIEFAFGDIADSILGYYERIDFKFENNKDAYCYYGDKYFEKSAFEYNASLATMTMSLAMSAFGSGNSDYAKKSENAVDLLKKIGVPENTINHNGWFAKKPDTDSIAVISGNKKIKLEDGSEYTLIPVMVRGAGYEKEWASNLTIGKSGQHQGFEEARDQVIDYLKWYVKSYKITGPVKFWVTGYSRAAATANLVAGALDDGIDFGNGVTYETKDVYAYCFETPAGALQSKTKNTSKYNNIFSIINPADPVPYVAPENWGFSRYGIDKYLPAKSSRNGFVADKKKMLEMYARVKTDDTYSLDNFRMKRIYTKGPHFDDNPNWWDKKLILFEVGIEDDVDNPLDQGTFLADFVTILAKDLFVSRANYVDNYQDGIREICSVFFGNDSKQNEKLINSVVSQAKDNWGDFVGTYVWNNVNPWGDDDAAFEVVEGWIKKGLKDAGIKGVDSKVIVNVARKLVGLLWSLATEQTNYSTTLICNYKMIGAAHYPELCFSWLTSMDKNYSYDNENRLTNGSYRVIRINCAVDVTVRDEDGQIVAQIVNEKPVELSSDDALLYGINENGEKIVILPADMEYDVAIKARENDKVNYGISEYNSNAADYTRIINYFDVDVTKGQTLNSNLPAYSAEELGYNYDVASATDYTVYSPNRTELTPACDLKDDAAEVAYFTMEAVSEDESKGVALGSGTYQYGSFAKVTAVPAEGYAFAGWYNGKTRVSMDTEYRVRMEKNEKLTAKFVTSDLGDVLIEDVPENGKIPEGIWAAGLTDVTYTGKAVTQNFRVYDNKKLLENKVDYTVSYKNNVNANTTSGTAKSPQVILKMKGKYSGTKTLYFKIFRISIKDNSDILFNNMTVQYNGKKQTPKPEVYYQGKKLSYGKDYTIPEYDRYKKSKTMYRGYEYGSTDYTLTIQAKNNYEGSVPITLSVVGKRKDYSKSSLPTIMLNKVTATKIPTQKYRDGGITAANLLGSNGKALKIELKYNKKTLVQDEDYTIVRIENGDKVGTAKLLIRGLKASYSSTGFSFAGDKYLTFKIDGKDIKSAKVTGLNSSYTFTGKYIRPNAALEGISAANYTVTYKNNLRAGTAQITFTGKGAYTGTKTAKFKISKYPVSGKDIVVGTGEDIVTPYVKGGAKPKVNVSFKGVVLREGTDYAVSYKNNKAIADKTAELTISGKGEFTGTRTVKFSIKARNFKDGIQAVAGDVSVDKKATWYVSSVTLYDSDGSVLKQGTDYEKDIKFFNETSGGYITAEALPKEGDQLRAEITGKGNYSADTIYAKYKVIPADKNIKNMTIQISKQEYTGNPITITGMGQIEKDKNGKYIAYIKQGKTITYLELGKDFVIETDSYKNNVNPGKASITVKGIGAYGGRKTVSFSITNRSLEKWWKGIFG